jgi:hypothetical protein
MNRSTLAGLLVLSVLIAGCAATPSPSVSPAASAAPSPSSGPAPTVSELRYRLVDQLGLLWYCDRDFYPVARADEADLAIQRFPEVRADREAFVAVVAHLGLDATGDMTADQKLAIYRAWKQLAAIVLDPGGAGGFRFDYLNVPAPGATDGRRTVGTIAQDGTITIEQQVPAGAPNCPICLARGTRIATPDGPVAIEAIRVGMPVWSIDATGKRIIATVVKVGHTPVPASHEVVRLVLDDGRVLRASPGHPLADGRRLGSIRTGDRVDGAKVTSAELEPYDGGSTFDLLPDGPTGIYMADGVPLGSTLGPGQAGAQPEPVRAG